MKKKHGSGCKGKNEKGLVNRRTFLKFSALTGLALGTKGTSDLRAEPSPSSLANGEKSQKIEWVCTSCLNCPARCGIKVKVSQGKAVQIMGNRSSKVSDGKICPRGHVGTQVLYDPGRIHTPLKRTQSEKGRGIDPKWTPISWDQALEEVSNRLNLLRESGQVHQLLLFSGLNSRSGEDLLQRFADSFGTPNVITGNGLEQESEKAGNWMADGRYAGCAYDLDHTNYILSFGGDLLESCQPVSRFLRKWGKVRRENPNRTKVVIIQPRYSMTAAKSDEWIPIQPGTEGALAMAIAHVILSEELYDASFVKDWTAGFELYRESVLRRFQPEKVSKMTGIAAETIVRIAREFARTQPAIAFRGKGALAWPEGSYTSYAIHCLNALVGSIDVPGGVLYQEDPGYLKMPEWVRDEIAEKGLKQPPLDFHGTERFPLARVVTNQVPESLLKGTPYPIQMAMGFNSNFPMTAPGLGSWDQALKKIPYYVHLSPFISEMAQYADLVLPTTVFLEEWGYDHSPPGSGFAEVRIKQPVVKPKGKERSASDILFLLAGRIRGGVGRAFTLIGDHPEGFVKLRTESLLPWEELSKKGVWTEERLSYRRYKQDFDTPSKKFEFSSGNLRSLYAKMGKKDGDELAYIPHYRDSKFLGEEAQYPLILFPYQPLLVVENGSQNYPWAQEIFLPMHGKGWGNDAEINSETARSLKLRNGDEVWIESAFGKVRTKIKVSEGVHPKIIAVPTGQGHTSYGTWQRGIGSNPLAIVGIDFDRLSGQAAFFNTRVKVYKA
jgi:thiosulfate reductase / polysulfide reductase chain A